MIETKTAGFEMKGDPDGDGVFEGYASVFGVVDNGLDVVERGAFEASIAKRKVKMLWHHNPGEVIGVWQEIAEDHRGLRVKGRLISEVEKGREALALLKAGAIDSLSIGYRTKRAVSEGSGSIRKLIEVDLFEVSLVTFPMLDDAVITDVKNLKSKRDVESILRDAGVPNQFAKLLAIHGYDEATKRLKDERREAGVKVDEPGLRALYDKITKQTEIINARSS